MGKMRMVVLLVVCLFALQLASAVFSSSYTARTPTSQFAGYHGSAFNSAMCREGQDFMLQVSPLGCTPSVVRSDLLEKQDVPVFCPITAVQLNPLIDVGAIDGMYISGEYAEGVSSVGFYPARAALGYGDPSVDSAVLGNVGYAVIVLSQNRNESSMPDFISGNLTARVNYDVQEHFGVGESTLYLPVMDEDEWNARFNQYGFWEGMGYLRAESISDDAAMIGVYSGKADSSSTYGGRVTSRTISVGQTSSGIALSGSAYCLAGLNIRLDDLEAKDKTARLEINGEYTEVKEGEKFLNNRCRVRKIDSYGIVDEVVVSCNEDSRSTTFAMTFSPKVRLDIDGVIKDVGLGERLYIDENGENGVYLAYIGTRGDTLREEDLVVGLVSVPGTDRTKLRESELEAFGDYFNSAPNGDLVGMITSIDNAKTAATSVLRGLRTAAEISGRWLVQGVKFDSISIAEGDVVFGQDLEIVGFGEPVDADLSVGKPELLEYYDNAVKDFESVINSYSDEMNYYHSSNTLGVDAFNELINVNYNVGQKRKVAELCAEFRDAYPGEPITVACDVAAKLSSSEIDTQDVVIQNKIYRMSLEGVHLPSFEEFGAEVSVKMPDGSIEDFDLRKEVVVVIDEDSGAYIQLLDVENFISEQSIRIRTNVREGVFETAGELLVGSDIEISIKKGFPSSRGGYVITLGDVNLERVAKVTVIPEIRDSGTTAGFPFKIGIEKRAIQLSPKKTQELADSLNDTIDTWRGYNDDLGKIVGAWNVACLATGTGLSIKNFFLSLSGEGAARQLVMRGANGQGGWFEKCGEGSADSRDVDACLLENSDAIEAAVDEVAGVISAQDEMIKKLQEGITTSRFLEEDVVDTEALLKKYLDDDGLNGDYSERVGSDITTTFDSIEVSGEEVALERVLEMVDEETIYMSQARDLEMNAMLLHSDDETVKEVARKNVERILSEIYVNNHEEDERQNYAQQYGFTESALISSEEMTEVPITDVKTFGEVKSGFGGDHNIEDSDYVYIVRDRFDGKSYLLVLDNSFVVQQTYRNYFGILTLQNETNPLKLSMEFRDSGAYENRYDNPELSYYESGKYKGFPAIVPFDVENGWYAGVRSTLPTLGAIQAYDDSGRISSFYLCNVGENNREEFFSSLSDDKCVMINPGSNTPYNVFLGLDSNEASRLAANAVRAIGEASQAYRSGVSEVRVTSPSGVSRTIEVGATAVGTPDIQCQDFMSATDCQLMFNVCDPVVCPSSRCDLGGTYPVNDVAASGVFGSIALCMPNYPEVKVPICLSGVHAGVDAYLSVLENYQDCLEHSLETGQQMGVCDELHSIYMCDFFWRQSVPLASAALPSVLGKVVGNQGTRGGGEYLSVPEAWDDASDSAEFFTKQYAANSFEAFKVRSTTGVGTEICKNWVSLRAPDGGDLLSSITKPRSPAQYYGRFEETPFTTATVPPTSHYKVFYHIYAGNDVPAYYQVYLRSTGQAFYQDTASQRIVASGFIPTGEYATCGTNLAYPCDFTAPSGYSEMCIRVNGNEECGFSQVTTDYGVNYLADQYVADEASRNDITSERDCVSGSVNMMNLLVPGVEDVVEPEIYNYGITRVCATSNPGSATDPYADREGSRWVKVGYCDSVNVGCWIDTQSVSEAVGSTNIADEVVQDVSEDYLDALQREGHYMSDSAFSSFISGLERESNKYTVINKITENLGKVFWNYQKGTLIFLRGAMYADAARIYYDLSYGEITGATVEDQSLKEKGAENRLESVEGITEMTPEEKLSIEQTLEEIEDVPESILAESDENVDASLVDFGFDELRVGLVRHRWMDNFLGDLLNFDDVYMWDGFAWWDPEGVSAFGADSLEGYKNGLLKIREDVMKEYEQDTFTRLELRCNGENYIVVERNALPFTNVIELLDRTIREKCGGDETGDSGSGSGDEDVTCSTYAECQKVLGDKVAGIAFEVFIEKVNNEEIEMIYLSNNVITQDTGLKSFGCLVLAVAYQESKLQHCGSAIGTDFQEDGDPLYCDGFEEFVLPGDDHTSFGVMQMSEYWHGLIPEFEKNVRAGVSYLIAGYNDDAKKFEPTQKSYSGWNRALRNYNGWGYGGNDDYVEDALSSENVEFLKNMFPEYC